MTHAQVKWLFYTVWIVVLLLGPLTVFANSGTSVFSDPVLLVNFFQRVTGLLAFSLLFVQILLGSFNSYFVRFMGGNAIRFHIAQGIISYLLFLAHPLLYVVFTYQTLGIITTFIWPNLSMNSLTYELSLSYGRIGFLLLSLGVVAGYFRTHPFFRRNWKKLHILNYFAFFFVSYHAYKLGSDTMTPPFNLLFWGANIGVTATVFKRFIYWRIKKYLPEPQTPTVSS